MRSWTGGMVVGSLGLGSDVPVVLSVMAIRAAAVAGDVDVDNDLWSGRRSCWRMFW